MKKSMVFMLLMSLVLVISYGCASKDYVRQQTDPLADRISRLEAASRDSSTQLGERVTKLEAGCSAAKAEADKAARDAAEALQTAKESRNQGDIAADRAEAAARRSEAAAKKAEKAFELHQRKYAILAGAGLLCQDAGAAPARIKTRLQET